jgi:hypothetical protein
MQFKCGKPEYVLRIQFQILQQSFENDDISAMRSLGIKWTGNT